MFGINLHFLKKLFTHLTCGDIEAVSKDHQEVADHPVYTPKEDIVREPIDYPPHIVERFRGRSIM